MVSTTHYQHICHHWSCDPLDSLAVDSRMSTTKDNLCGCSNSKCQYQCHHQYCFASVLASTTTSTRYRHSYTFGHPASVSVSVSASVSVCAYAYTCAYTY